MYLSFMKLSWLLIYPIPYFFISSSPPWRLPLSFPFIGWKRWTSESVKSGKYGGGDIVDHYKFGFIPWILYLPGVLRVSMYTSVLTVSSLGGESTWMKPGESQTTVDWHFWLLLFWFWKRRMTPLQWLSFNSVHNDESQFYHYLRAFDKCFVASLGINDLSTTVKSYAQLSVFMAHSGNTLLNIQWHNSVV